MASFTIFYISLTHDSKSIKYCISTFFCLNEDIAIKKMVCLFLSGSFYVNIYIYLYGKNNLYKIIIYKMTTYISSYVNWNSDYKLFSVFLAHLFLNIYLLFQFYVMQNKKVGNFTKFIKIIPNTRRIIKLLLNIH